MLTFGEHIMAEVFKFSDIKTQTVRTTVPDESVFGEEKGLSDVVLVIERTKIPVVRSVLGMVSPVFLRIFQSEFKLV